MHTGLFVVFRWAAAAAVTSVFGLASERAGIRLEGVSSPFPVSVYRFRSQRQDLEMVYMDVAPKDTPRGTVVLLHGKNFSGTYFGQTATALRESGYRVIMPDQIGFGKSTKPEHYYYTFHQLARNTRELLTSLSIGRVHVLGHSMGGMVAARFALLYPETTATLTLLDPLGLEDWKALGVPYATADDNYRKELAQTPEKLRAYEQESYYHGEWKPAYDPWLEQLVSFQRSPDYSRMAWNQALTSEMIFTQPVIYEFGALRPPVLLIIGQRDRTAIGKDLAPAEVKNRLGDYPALGRAAKNAIPGASLVELEGLGHLPHIEDFGRFYPPYRDFLAQHAEAAPKRAE